MVIVQPQKFVKAQLSTRVSWAHSSAAPHVYFLYIKLVSCRSRPIVKPPSFFLWLVSAHLFNLMALYFLYHSISGRYRRGILSRTAQAPRQDAYLLGAGRTQKWGQTTEAWTGHHHLPMLHAMMWQVGGIQEQSSTASSFWLSSVYKSMAKNPLFDSFAELHFFPIWFSIVDVGFLDHIQIWWLIRKSHVRT